MDRHIKDILKKFVTQKNINSGYYQQKIKEFWKSKMGPTIANRTSKIRFKNGILTVYVSSGPLRQELFNNRSKILSLLNDYLGEDVLKQVLIK